MSGTMRVIYHDHRAAPCDGHCPFEDVPSSAVVDVFPAGGQPHEHAWLYVAHRVQKTLGLAATSVLQTCPGCGDMKTSTLSGEWTDSDMGLAREYRSG